MTHIHVSIKLFSILLLSTILSLQTIRFGFCTNNLNVTCIEFERKALLSFKQGIQAPSGQLLSWVGKDCCKWNGVSCNEITGHVDGLELANEDPDSLTVQPLSGEISPSLLDLKDLSYLDLSMNNFEGVKIPNFIGSLQNLKYLNLSGSRFSGIFPPSLGNLSKLQYLDLSNNAIDLLHENGLIWLSGLSSLEYLNLGGLDLSKSAANWLQYINKLRLLQKLNLSACSLSNIPLNLPFINFTRLLVLDLSNNGFNSSMPQWLFNLTSLTTLDLNSNSLQGELPDSLANLVHLEILDLSKNSFLTGHLSRNLGKKLCTLRLLTLSINEFTGKITEFISGLSECTNVSLETMDLGYNKLSGNLPKSLGDLKSLRYLQLSQNSFEGAIPESIGNLSSLEEFYISHNQMSGNIPTSIGKISTLVALDLSENVWEGIITETHLLNLSSLKELTIYKSSPNISLVFNINSNWIPPFKLKFFNTRSCQLGPKFPAWLRNQNELTTLVLNNAKISDTIPDWFWKLNLQVDEFDIAYNQISGKVPNSLRFSYPSTADLSSNLFEGPLPLWSSNVTKLYLRDNRFSGPIPQEINQAMPFLSDLDISHNYLIGNIPLSVGNLTQLTTLVISNNFLTGEIPHFWNHIPMLYIVDMSNNSLSGIVPRSLGSLNYLRFLILCNNNLSGKLPSSLKNCSRMKSVDLGDNRFSGEIPAWIGENMLDLLILRMRSNFFSGKIPSQLCNLSNLHILDLSHNNLSGHIPSCAGDLHGFKIEFSELRYEGRLDVITKGRELEYYNTLYLVNNLDLSNNNLSGEMPIELTSLVKLGTLNLSMNHFTGTIPGEIDNLEKLETLDLSRNELSGPIPPSMAALTFLNHLNLSYNNLSGKIPTSNQFHTFNDLSIYEGNPGLCGDPLPNDCVEKNKTSSDHPEWDHREEDNDGNNMEKLWFFIGVATGFIVGFWGILGSLIMKSSWRLAYFEFIERMYYKMLLCFSHRH